jgi:hypothetical protein
MWPCQDCERYVIPDIVDDRFAHQGIVVAIVERAGSGKKIYVFLALLIIEV